MGLFSFFNKNKQDRAADDSGRFYSKDDDAALGERARAKRPSNAGGATARRAGNDPLLPEKKRARRRLVGAIALALAAAVGLPMLLDSGPKPLAGDIAIQIPSKDKAAPLPAPGEPEAQAAGDKAVAARDSVDQDEEIIEAPGAAPAPGPAASGAAAPVAPKAPAVAATAPKLAPPPAAPATSVQQDTRAAGLDARLAEQRAERAERADRERAEKAEREHAYRLERERAERAERERIAKAERAEKLRAEEKARARAEEKAVKPAAPHDSARAIAILEGKPAEKAKPLDAAGQKFVLQVAAMSSQEKAAEVQARLRDAGISSYTLKSGELIKVRVGPLNKEDAERMRARLGKLGLPGFMTPS